MRSPFELILTSHLRALLLHLIGSVDHSQSYKGSMINAKIEISARSNGLESPNSDGSPGPTSHHG